jgi:hypothetical protein
MVVRRQHSLSSSEPEIEGGDELPVPASSVTGVKIVARKPSHMQEDFENLDMVAM